MLLAQFLMLLTKFLMLLAQFLMLLTQKLQVQCICTIWGELCLEKNNYKQCFVQPLKSYLLKQSRNKTVVNPIKCLV